MLILRNSHVTGLNVRVKGNLGRWAKLGECHVARDGRDLNP